MPWAAITLSTTNLGGRSPIDAGLRALIRQMSTENVLWGASRIQGELLRLGFAVAQSTVAKCMAKRGGPSGQTWGTFLRNHAPHIAAMGLFVVPTISFVQLYVLLIVRLARRELVWINVTSHPTTEWIARQITEEPGPGHSRKWHHIDHSCAIAELKLLAREPFEFFLHVPIDGARRAPGFAFSCLASRIPT